MAMPCLAALSRQDKFVIALTTASERAAMMLSLGSLIPASPQSDRQQQQQQQRVAFSSGRRLAVVCA